MAYVVYNIHEKIEMSQFETMEKAHQHCARGWSEFHILLADTTFEDTDVGKYGTPVALYIKGKRYDLVPHED